MSFADRYGLPVPAGMDFGPEAARAVERRLRAEEDAEVERITRRTEEWLRGRRERRERERTGMGSAPQAAEPVERARRLLAELRMPGRLGAYVHGPAGTGKTSTAEALARLWGDGCYVLRDVEFAEALKGAFGGRGSVEALESRAACRGLLVWDDIGKARPSDWWCATVFGIVDLRVREGLPTVYTSNYGLSGLRARLAAGCDGQTAAAIESRIAGSCVDVCMDGADRRLR